MTNTEISNFIAEFVMNQKEAVLEAIEKDDISIVRDEAYEYIDCCDLGRYKK